MEAAWRQRMSARERSPNARGDVYTGNRYRVEYYGLKDDGEPATVTIDVIRSGGQLAAAMRLSLALVSTTTVDMHSSDREIT